MKDGALNKCLFISAHLKLFIKINVIPIFRKYEFHLTKKI